MPRRLLVAAPLLALLVVSLSVPVTATSDDGICHTTGIPPKVPFALDVCYMHSHNACCLTGYDKEIKNAYSAIISGGSGCKPGAQRIRALLYSLLRYLCIPCDPNEPSYRFESVIGDQVDGGVVPPSLNSLPGELTWRVCQSFLYGPPGKHQGIWGVNGSHYDDCGIVLQSCLSTPIFNMETQRFTSPSPNCSSESDLLIPSVAFRNSPNPALEMLSLIAQTMADFQIVVVNDSDPAYNYEKTPCFGRSSAASHHSAFSVVVSLALFLGVFLVT